MNRVAHARMVADARLDAAHDQFVEDCKANCKRCREVGPNCEPAVLRGGEWQHYVKDPMTGDYYWIHCGSGKMRDEQAKKDRQ